MRWVLGIVAALAFSTWGGPAPAQWPAQAGRGPFHVHGGHAHAPGCNGDDSPLRPQFAPWVFQPTCCKQPHWTGLHRHWGYARSETPQIYPPLPYGYSVTSVTPGAPPAPAPAPAAAAPATADSAPPPPPPPATRAAVPPPPALPPDSGAFP
jgi:hypothetical protein